MHAETLETSNTVFGLESSYSQSPPSQHGNYNDLSGSPPNSPYGETGGEQETGSEWSLSASPTPSEYDTGLNPIEGFLSERALLDDDVGPQSVGQSHLGSHFVSSGTIRGDVHQNSPIQWCPQEVLLHMLSHLPATDLLTAKLVSRRFQDLINSPHVWIGAFSKHFPGSNSVSSSRGVGQGRAILTTERRAFTRLSPVASWTSEYLLRTKLLRCLGRGRPSLPFAAPSQGKPNKGFATFSFHSRLRSVTNLDAKFGPVNDKRLPQFIHACSDRGAVSISDRRGELSGWGTTETVHPFRTFEEVCPGTAMWGEGRGEVVGVPNVMPVSTIHGVVCAEGYPGGHCFLMTSNDKFPGVVGAFLGDGHRDLGIPRLLRSSNSFCSAWIAKTHSVPRQTHGIVGMLFGSSYGVISACSLGIPGTRGQRIERGELTARWIVSPGVPIIAIHCDENLTIGRVGRNRVWAVALNALGEVFYLRGFPKLSPRDQDHTLAPEVAQEARAWQIGRTVTWSLVRPSQRAHRPSFVEDDESPAYFPASVWSARSSTDELPDFNSVERWLYKTPTDIRACFNGWDMRRRLEVDFGGDDGDDTGQSIFVFRCGHEDNIVDGERDVRILRYTRHQNPETATNMDSPLGTERSETLINTTEWRTSQLLFGRSHAAKLTATAIDSSIYAVTTLEEDKTLLHTRLSQKEAGGRIRSSNPGLETSSSPKIPGQRARFVAVGTATGQVYLWNARAAVSASHGVTNEILPSRIIQTPSPEVSSIALSALYVVHGGSDGLVQAWDPLCSTIHPIRTICSAMSRRALIATQQDANNSLRHSSAVGAICLDPDPTLLRGIVALRGNLRYWSYSSATTIKDSSNSQKRRLNRMTHGVRPGTSDGFTGARRVDLKGFVNQEMAERGLEERDKLAEEKRHKRINGRFGLDLLGNDASEEELIAYATLLSEEEQERQALKSVEKKLPKDASEAEVEAHLSGLSGEDLERWKYASWQDRFEMPTSEPGTVGGTTPTSTPALGQASMEEDLARAMKLSLEETQGTPSATSEQGSSHREQGGNEDEIAEAIRRSLEPTMSSPLIPAEKPDGDPNEDEDLSEAIRLSLQDQTSSTSSSASRSESRSHSLSAADSEDFPSLGKSPVTNPPPGVWSKGKRRA